MASKLTEISLQRKGLEADFLTRKATDWLRDKVKSIRSPERAAVSILNEPQRQTRFQLGGMYFFMYDPKTKEQLPYYDIFPLVIPLERYADGFLGINLHYLPVRLRANFLDKLTDFAVYNENDEVRRVKATYEILSQTRRYKELQPCLKRYLFNNVKSRLATVLPGEWETAIFLPVEQFQKQSKRVVHQESMQEIKG
jgi:hypothetical protein